MVNESDYLTLAKMVFPADDEMTLMKLAINQQWVQLIDGKVVYAVLPSMGKKQSKKNTVNLTVFFMS